MTTDNNDLRIWSINANTLLTHNNFSELHESCISALHNKITILCLQEININIYKRGIRNTIKKVLKQHFPTFNLLLSSTPIHSPTIWKPGGTMMVTIGEIAHSIQRTHTNNLGRWCMTRIEQANQQFLTIFNVYNTVDTNIKTAGPSTIYMQQWKLLRLAGIIKPNPRNQFIQDLSAQVGAAIKNKSNICIIRYFNEILRKDPTLMSSLCVQHQLYDPFGEMFPEDSDISTYNQGPNRIDYTLISKSLKHPTNIGYNPYSLIYSSDH